MRDEDAGIVRTRAQVPPTGQLQSNNETPPLASLEAVTLLFQLSAHCVLAFTIRNVHFQEQ